MTGLCNYPARWQLYEGSKSGPIPAECDAFKKHTDLNVGAFVVGNAGVGCAWIDVLAKLNFFVKIVLWYM